MKHYTSLTLLTIVTFFMFSCNSKQESTTIQNNGQKIKVRLQQVIAEEVDQLYEYTAIVQAEAVNNIASTIPGRIDKIFVEVGDHVKKGQTLVQMDEASLEQAKSQLDNLELTFNRLDQLYKVGGISKSDWDAQKTALDVARTSFQNLSDNTKLTSPLAGIITARNYDSGDIYSGTPILQVQQITPVKMKINVSENHFTKVKTGMSAEVALEVFDGEIFKGKVTLIYPTIDSRTHTFPVEVSLPNTNEKVRPGMYARVTMNYGSNHSVVVPDVSIIKQQGSGDRFVYVYKDGKVFYKKVELGRRLNDRYEILSGIEDGDMVVISSHTKLNDGMEVEVVE